MMKPNQESKNYTAQWIILLAKEQNVGMKRKNSLQHESSARPELWTV